MTATQSHARPSPGDDYGSPDGSEQQSPGISNSVLALLAQVLRHPRLLLGMPLLMAFVIGGGTLLSKTYTTTVSFTPVSADPTMASVAGIAGQLGIGVPGADPSSSPDFYAELLLTADILRPLAMTRYTAVDGKDTLRGNLLELYEVSESTPGRSMFKMLAMLRKDIVAVEFDRTTSIVRITVTTDWPEVSLAIAERLLDLINEFNSTSRRTNGAAQRDFLRQRLDTAKAEREVAERALQAFLIRNHSIQGDPALQRENDALRRELAIRQDVYALLVQNYEQARLTAVRNTPAISLLEHPILPLRHDPRGAIVKTALGGIFGGIVAVVMAIGLEMWKREDREGSTGREELLLAFEQFKSGLWRRRRATAK